MQLKSRADKGRARESQGRVGQGRARQGRAVSQLPSVAAVSWLIRSFAQTASDNPMSHMLADRKVWRELSVVEF